MLVRALVAVEPLELRRRVVRLVEERTPASVLVAGRSDVWQRLHREDVDLVLVSRPMLPASVAAWVASVRGLPERPEVVVLADREDAQDRAALLAAGCMAVLSVGLTDPELADTLATIVDRRGREGLRWLRDGREPGPHLDEFVSESPSMRHFLSVARRVVDSDSSLLILGETGTGKERLARSIHAGGPHANGPFLAVNCGALPESLLESELFGHEQGAFTGASRARRGYFELAHGGTLFLDEIGDMPQHLQVKLLRVLEDRQVHRLGGEREIRVDVRLMAATNRDLEDEVRNRRFRADLYYRLAVVTLTLPPLRERREDIPGLVRNFIGHFASTLGRPVEGLEPAAMAALVRYDWPGNVRELINVLERAVLLCGRPRIDVADLPRSITGLGLAIAPGPTEPGSAAVAFDPSLHRRPLREARREALRSFTRAYLAEQLRATGGRIGETARLAGIGERSLHALMKRYGLDKDVFRERRSEVRTPIDVADSPRSR